MAADIKNYLKEKEKRQKSQDDYKKKIRISWKTEL